MWPNHRLKPSTKQTDPIITQGEKGASDNTEAVSLCNAVIRA